MRKVVIVLCAFILAGAVPLFAKGKEMRISLVLSPEEAKTIPNTKYSYVSQPKGKAKDLLVSKEVLLSEADIQGMIVITKEDTKMKELPFIDIVFSPDGSKKLEKVTTDNLRKSIAIMFGDEILSAPYIIYPMAKGHIMVSHWSVDTNEEAANLVKEAGFTPIFKGQVQKTLGNK